MDYDNTRVPTVTFEKGMSFLGKKLLGSLRNRALWTRPQGIEFGDLAKINFGGLGADQLFGFQPSDRFVFETVKTSDTFETKTLGLKAVELDVIEGEPPGPAFKQR